MRLSQLLYQLEAILNLWTGPATQSGTRGHIGPPLPETVVVETPVAVAEPEPALVPLGSPPQAHDYQVSELFVTALDTQSSQYFSLSSGSDHFPPSLRDLSVSDLFDFSSFNPVSLHMSPARTPSSVIGSPLAAGTPIHIPLLERSHFSLSFSDLRPFIRSPSPPQLSGPNITHTPSIPSFFPSFSMSVDIVSLHSTMPDNLSLVAQRILMSDSPDLPVPDDVAQWARAAVQNLFPPTSPSHQSSQGSDPDSESSLIAHLDNLLAPPFPTTSFCRRPAFKPRSPEMEIWVRDLLAAGVIEPAPSGPYSYLSHCFLLSSPKSRLIANFHALSVYLPRLSMRLPSYTKHLRLIPLPSDLYAIRLDLAHAFYQIPIAPCARHTLRVQFWAGGPHFQFTRLPMGLSQSPAVLQSVLSSILRAFSPAPSFRWLHLDDILVLAPLSWFSDNLSAFLAHLASARVTINTSKSILTPTQSLIYCGLSINLRTRTVSPTPVIVAKLLLNLWLLAHSPLSPHQRRQVRGYLSYALPLVGCTNAILQHPQPLRFFLAAMPHLSPMPLLPPSVSLSLQWFVDASTSGVAIVDSDSNLLLYIPFQATHREVYFLELFVLTIALLIAPPLAAIACFERQSLSTTFHRRTTSLMLPPVVRATASTPTIPPGWLWLELW